MTKGKLLIIDDNKDVLAALEILLEEEFDVCTTLSNPNQIPEETRRQDYDVILLDMNFSSRVNTGNEGLFWLREIRNQSPDTVVIMFTAYGDINLAVSAMKEGATDFIIKPWENDKLLATLKTGVQLSCSRRESKKLKQVQGVYLEDMSRHAPILSGSSSAFQRIIDVIEKTAPTDANILLTGENGTGKSLIAQEIHRKSNRNQEAFIPVDLGSIHENLFESELFGHVRGAFTDARSDRTGRIETAEGGTLFLDEIANLSLPMQAKLLTVLQEKRITPLGSNTSKPVDIRLICATNKILSQEVTHGDFREDLYYRINTIDIEIPPLRQRPEDIEELVEQFFTRFKSKYKKSEMSLSEAYITLLKQHPWPGNVRELEHVVEQSVILAETNILDMEDFHTRKSFSTEMESSVDKTLEEIEKEAILKALHKHGGNQVQAARELNITRQTIHNKIKRYGL